MTFTPCTAAMATHLTILLHSAKHDNGPALVLPDHPPEVIDSVLQWSLGSNVGSTLSVALHTHMQNHVLQ